MACVSALHIQRHLVCIAMLACVSCSDAQDGVAAIDDVRPPAGKIDGGGSWTGDIAPPPSPGPPPTTLPVGASSVLRIGSGPGLDIIGAVFGDAPSPDTGLSARGGIFVVYDHFTADYADAELRAKQLADATFGGAPQLTLSDNEGSRYEASPSAATLGGVRYLYSARAQALSGAATLQRRPLVAPTADAAPDRWGQAELVKGPSLSLLSWPQVLALPDGRAALAYRNGLSQPRLALSADAGKSFGAPQAVANAGAAMVAVGGFADGQLAVSYQAPQGAEPMVSWVRLSRDGASWSTPLRVSSSSSNVHDTTLVARNDGGLDLYYIYPAGPQGFALFRRQLRGDGTLGAEQRVTDDSVGEVSKPTGARLADGRLLLTYAEIAQRDPVRGEPTQQLLCALLISGDAD
jgi:hypothetical protein